MQAVRIYIMTDITGIKKQNGNGIYVLETEGKPAVKRCGAVNNVNSNGAEVVVLKAALREADRRIGSDYAPELYLQTDYVSGAIAEKRLQKWKEMGWHNSRNQPLANMEAWQEIEKLLQGKEVKVHTGEEHTFTSWMKTELKINEK